MLQLEADLLAACNSASLVQLKDRLTVDGRPVLVLGQIHGGEPSAAEKPDHPVSLHDFPDRDLHHRCVIKVAAVAVSALLASLSVSPYGELR